jgi:hypothetical protein
MENDKLERREREWPWPILRYFSIFLKELKKILEYLIRDRRIAGSDINLGLPMC